jgi:hypothetical protein
MINKVTSFFKGLSPTGWIIFAIIVVVLIAVIIYISSKSKDTTKEVSANNNLATNLSNATPRSVFPMGYGAKGEEVKALQRYLVGKGEVLVIDGVWGPLTDKAVNKVLKVQSISSELFATLK